MRPHGASPTREQRLPAAIWNGRRRASAALAVLLAAVWPVLATADEPLQYRRIYVPEDELTRLGDVYLPVSKAEFDRLLNAIRSRQMAPGQGLGARITAATYQARLVGTELVDGRADLAISHAGVGPAALPLEPCGLVVGETTWTARAPASAPEAKELKPAAARLSRPAKSPVTPPPAKPGQKQADDDDTPASPPAADAAAPDAATAGKGGAAHQGADAPRSPTAADAATAGEGGAASPAVKLGLTDRDQWVATVEGPGNLRFPWSLMGRRGPQAELCFDLKLPACPVNRLVLELPEQLQPVTDQGVTSSAADATPIPGIRTWTIDLGGVHHATLRVIPADRDWKSQRLTLLRQLSAYRFTPQGADVKAELRFDVYQGALDQVLLNLEPGLELVEAVSGDQRLRWSQTAGPGAASQQVILELPEPLTGADRLVRLQAVATATPAGRWRLPLVTVQNCTWLEGRVTLEVPRPLVLNQLDTTGCLQESMRAEPAAEGTESLSICCFLPRPSIQVRVQARQDEIVGQLGTSVRLGESSSTAQLIADLTSPSGPRFQLEMELSSYWTVDNVDSEPPGALEDWSVLQAPGKKRRLLLRLRDSLRPDHPLRLAVHARGRGLAPDSTVPGDQLRLGTFAEVKAAKSWLALSAESPRQIRIAGDIDLPRIDPASLAPAEQGRLTLVPGGVVVPDDEQAADWTVALSTEAPTYAAEISLESVLEEKQVEQTVRVHCLPKASSLSRLLVHFSEAAEVPWTWTLDADPPVSVEARRLTPQEQQEAGLRDGETWQVVLPQPQASPFELRAECSVRSAKTFAVPLVYLPGAASQTGWLAIRTPLAVPLVIDHENVRPVAPDAPAPGHWATTRSAFRYEPSQGGRVTVRRGSTEGLPPLVWAWSCELVSRVACDGQVAHTCWYQLENNGAAQVTLPRPLPSRGWRVAIDGRELSAMDDGGGRPAVPIPLPRGVRFPTVRLEYTTQGVPLHGWSELPAACPEPEFPVLARRWIVWLPPDYDTLPAAISDAAMPWSRRLFGPLTGGRELPASGRPVLGARQTDSVLAAPDPQAAEARAFLEKLARGVAAPTPAAEDRSLTWAELLDGCEDAGGPQAGTREAHLLIDQVGLARLGLTATTAVGTPDFPPASGYAAAAGEESGAEQGARLLEAAHLRLVACGPSWLVTDPDTMALFARELDTGTGARVAGVLHARNRIAAVLANGSRRFVRLAAWRAVAPPPLSRWTAESCRAGSELAQAGWTAHQVTTSPSHDAAGAELATAVPITVFRPKSIEALGWVALLVMTGLVWSLTRRRVVLAAPLTAAAGLFALGCPAYLAPVGSGVFLGALLAAVLVLFRPDRASPAHARTVPTAAKSSVLIFTTRLWLGLGLAAGLAGLGIGVVVAAEPARETKAVPAGDKIHRVYSAVGADQRPVGDYVYVTRAFYEALHREAAAGLTKSVKWLLQNAEYRIAFLPTAADEEAGAIELVARYEVDVLQAGTKLLLPIPAEQVFLLPNRARWDGQPATVAWSGEGLTIDAPAAGPGVLELAFRPKLDRRDGSAGFDLRIPRVPRSLVRFDLSAAMREVRVPSALGGLELDPRTGERLVRLGPAERLSVHWPLEPASPTAASELEVDQLMWLSVEPGSVMLRSRFTFRSSLRPLQQIRLQLDPRLRWLPPAHEPAGVECHVRSAAPPTLFLELQPPYPKEFSWEAAFLVKEATGLGRIPLPQLQPISDRVRRRWLAVTVAPSLQLELSTALGDRQLAAAEFTAAWPLPQPPLSVLDLASVPDDASITTNLRTPKTTVEQQLETIVGSESADLLWEAAVTVTNGAVFQHRVQVPRDVTVRSVSIWDHDMERVARWSRDDQGAVNVMLTGPASDSHTLRVAGQQSLPRNGLWKLPRIALAGAELRQDRVDVYRRPQVQVAMPDVAGYQPIPGRTPGRYQAGRGRLVAALETTASSPSPLQLGVTRNRPHVQARLILLLTRLEQAWQATADYQLDVDDGLVDALRLEIPEEWPGPFEVDVDATLQTVGLPGQTRRFLILRPAAPVAGRYRVRIRGPVTTAPGERTQAPDVLPVDVDRVDRYLVAPTRIQQRQIAWETSGLQAAALPEDYGAPQLPSFVSYQSLGPRFQATIKDVKAESGTAQIRLADVRLDCQASGRWLGFATFDVEPAGRTDVDLQLGQDQKLIHVLQAGLPALLQPVGPQQWRVSLRHRQLPQTIQVLFSGRWVPGADPARCVSVPAPCLVGLPVEQTLWTVCGPVTAQWPDLLGEDLSDVGSQDLQRLKSIAASMQSGASVFAESVPQDMVRWYQPWAQRWFEVRERWEQYRFAAGADARSDADALAALDRQQEILAAKIRAAGGPELTKTVLEPLPLLDCWTAGLDAGPMTTSCRLCAGFAPTIDLEPGPERTTRLDARWAVATELLGLALLAFLLLPHPALAHALTRFAPLVGLLLGLAWWCWAAPGFLGLLLAAASLLVWLTSPRSAPRREIVPR